jgi:hypothetical protein
MVREMLGQPEAVSSKVYKETKTEVWKYQPIDARRLGSVRQWVAVRE